MQQFKVIDFKGLKLLYLQEIIKIAIIFFIIQFLLIYMDVNLYISCIYCPLIYLYKRNINHRFMNEQDYILIYRHFFLYFSIVIFSVLDFEVLFLWFSLLYFIFYAILINRELTKKAEVVYFTNSKQLISLFIYFIILGICITILRLFEFYFGSIFGFSTRFILLGALLMNILFSVVSLLSLRKVKNRIAEHEEPVISSDLGFEILDFFEKSELYLNPSFSITNLAKALGVRKEAISTVVNGEMKMSFYTLVAKYRIDYAKQILLTQEHFTIESIVEQSGFHSRTTFNKYFQRFVGSKPSEYRKEQLGNIEKTK